MSHLNRRTALLGLGLTAVATPILLTAQAAVAQTAPAEGDEQTDYVVQTLTVGTVALKTSEVAATKASDPMVKEFAQLEVAEQKAIASVLASTDAGKTPPDLPAEEADKVQKMQDMESGADFDTAYVDAQIDGHNKLLEIQKSISGDTVATVEAITAKLAEQAITSHLAMLKHIKDQLGTAPAA